MPIIVVLELGLTTTIYIKCLFKIEYLFKAPTVSISSCQGNLMKTYHNEANTSGITKIASRIFLEFFEQSS